MDSVSEAKLDLINPLFAAKVRTLAEMMEEYGEPIKVEQGIRSWDEQQNKWLQGRDEAGNIIDKNKIVTYAKPGYSWHMYGMAVDCCPISLLPKPGWDSESPIWYAYGSKAESLGLVWGGRWRRPVDLPHVQMTGRFPVTPTDEVRQLYRNVKMQGVWVEAGLQVLRT